MGTNFGEELMGRMADLDAELHELPDEAKDFMQGFMQGRDEGIIIGQAEGEIMERERIIALLENQHNFDQIFLDAVDNVIALITGKPDEE